MRADSLEPADQNAEPRGIEELDLLHVNEEVELALVDQVDELLTELRRRIDVDLSFHVDDSQAIFGGVVVHLQVHISSCAVPRVVRGATEPRPRFNHAPALHTYEIATWGGAYFIVPDL